MDFSILIAVIYLVVCYLFFGITKDFSSTYYKWKEYNGAENSNLKLLFPAFLAVVSFGLFFAIESTQFWFVWKYSPWWFWWITIVGIVFLWMVFIAPNYRDKPNNIVHVSGAIGGIVFLMLYGLLTKTWFFEIPFWLVYFLLKRGKIKFKNPTYVVEFLALVTIVFVFKYGYEIIQLL